MLEGTYSHDSRRRTATQDMERALPHYKRNIEKKLTMRYGSDCALVVYHLGSPPISHLRSQAMMAETVLSKKIRGANKPSHTA